MKRRKHTNIFGTYRDTDHHEKSNNKMRGITPLRISFGSALAGLGMIALSSSAHAQAVPLGDAGDFTIIGSSTITNTGALTIVNGNVALSPGTSITGFPPGTILGTVHINDMTAENAQADALTAYNTLAGLDFTTDLTSMPALGSGQTLLPGVYNFDSSASLGGILNLDTGIDPNAVFVFQIGSTLTTASNSQVVVQGAGALTAPNIFWQVGSSATFGTGTIFTGNVIALASITMNTGATLTNGRLIALNGAVTLDDNSNISAPAAPPAALGRYWNGRDAVLVNGNLWSGMNWSTTESSGDTIALGTNVDVFFSVVAPPLVPINQNTNLDFDVTISSLTVNDSVEVTIGGSNKLTISSTGLITGINVNNGAGLVTISSDLELGYLSQVIDVNNDAGMLISGVVSGTNGLTKAGTERLTLTGTETYTGATVVSEGTLQLGDGVTIGTSIASSDSVFIGPDGTLDINLANGGTFGENVTNNGQIQWIADGTNTQTSSSVFSGIGGMTVDALGTAVILGDNTYTGDTVVTAGTLQLGNGVIANSSIAFTDSILVEPAGIFALNLANGEMFANSITNNGEIQWIANGENTQADTSVFSGNGSMLVTAPGTTILLGSNTFTGGTTINTPGDVFVGNPLAFGAGVLTITNGTIDTVDSESVQIEVGGYEQTGGQINMHLGGTTLGSYTRYDVAGNVVLDGGTVYVYDLTSGYVPQGGDQQNIIHADGMLSGEFDSNLPDSLFYNAFLNQNVSYSQGSTLLYPTITYDYPDDDVFVTWVQDAFASLLDLTPNQTAVANSLDAGDAPANVVDYLNTQNIALLPDMYDLIAPDELTAIYQMGFTGSEIQNANIKRHLERVRQGSSRETQYTQTTTDSKGGMVQQQSTRMSDTKRWTAFFEGTDGSASVDGDYNSEGYDFDTRGGNLGVDYRFSDRVSVGIMGSYADSHASLVNGGSIEAESFKGAIYATIYDEAFYVDALLGAGHHSYDTRRVGLLGLAQGSTEAFELDAMLNTGYDIKNGNWTYGPTASVAYTRMMIDSFTETGSLAPLHFPDQHQDSLRTELGGKIAYNADFNGMRISPQVRLAWQHEFMDSKQAMESSFVGGTGSTFIVHGPDMDRDRAVLSAGLTIQVTPTLSIYGFYDGHIGSSDYKSNQVTAGVKLDF